MCGIAGEYAFSGQVADEIIPNLLGLLWHRGPDGWGVLLNPERSLLMLHTRLAIVDTVAGSQPMSNEDGSIWVALNGELYGFQEIRSDLIQQGHTFKTHCDTEILVHLYEQYGESFVDHLRGEFAFALYDRNKNRVYLVRDRFGIKPLYYSSTPASLVFASEAKALFAHPRVKREIDEVNLNAVIHGLHLPGESIFRGIKQLEPGCMLRIDENGFTTLRYWDVPLYADTDNGETIDERKRSALAEEFRAQFYDAVRLRLHGDVPVGTYLSGGIDSAAVALSAARFQGDIKTFTVGFEDGVYDESARARSISASAGLKNYVEAIGSGSLANDFVRSIWYSEIPAVNSHGTAKYRLSNLAKKQVTAVLTGEGADEVLLGYAQFRHLFLLESARQQNSRKAQNLLKSFVKNEGLRSAISLNTKYQDYDRIIQMFGSYPYPVLRALSLGGVVRFALSQGFRASTKSSDPIAELAARLGDRIKGLHPLHATQYVLFRADLPGYILNYLGDRQEMAHSLEGRLPFLDHHLVEYACGLPIAAKLGLTGDKQILRDSMAPLMNGCNVGGKKQVFLAPSSRSLGLHKGGGHLSSYLSQEVTSRVGVLSRSAVSTAARAVRHLPKNSRAFQLSEGFLTLALSIHILHDLFIDKFKYWSEQFADFPKDYLSIGQTYVCD